MKKSHLKYTSKMLLDVTYKQKYFTVALVFVNQHQHLRHRN